MCPSVFPIVGCFRLYLNTELYDSKTESKQQKTKKSDLLVIEWGGQLSAIKDCAEPGRRGCECLNRMRATMHCNVSMRGAGSTHPPIRSQPGTESGTAMWSDSPYPLLYGTFEQGLSLQSARDWIYVSMLALALRCMYHCTVLWCLNLT